MTPRLTLDYGLRWDLYTPITERAHRTSAFRTVNGVEEYMVNPQPGYRTNWHAFEPRVQLSMQVPGNLQAHVGGGIMVIPPNIWQDNFLTGATPISITPRVIATSSAPIRYGLQITSDQLPHVYSLSGTDIYAKWKSPQVPSNTPMDVERYQSDLASLTHVFSDLTLQGIDASFGNATMYTWTAGLERKIGNLTADAAYVGTASEKLPHFMYPNAFPGASPGFAPQTKFDAAGNVIGGLA